MVSLPLVEGIVACTKEDVPVIDTEQEYVHVCACKQGSVDLPDIEKKM